MSKLHVDSTVLFSWIYFGITVSPFSKQRHLFAILNKNLKVFAYVLPESGSKLTGKTIKIVLAYAKIYQF